MSIAELDPARMKKANSSTDGYPAGRVPDASIQKASPRFLLITGWKLLLKQSELGTGQQHSSKGVLAAVRAWQPWKQIQEKGHK